MAGSYCGRLIIYSFIKSWAWLLVVSSEISLVVSLGVFIISLAETAIHIILLFIVLIIVSISHIREIGLVHRIKTFKVIVVLSWPVKVASSLKISSIEVLFVSVSLVSVSLERIFSVSLYLAL